MALWGWDNTPWTTLVSNSALPDALLMHQRRLDPWKHEHSSRCPPIIAPFMDRTSGAARILFVHQQRRILVGCPALHSVHDSFATRTFVVIAVCRWTLPERATVNDITTSQHMHDVPENAAACISSRSCSCKGLLGLMQASGHRRGPG